MAFVSAISNFAKKAKDEMDKEYRKNVLALWRDTVQGTPRITGVLRANWQIGVDSQNGSKLSANGLSSGPISSLKIQNTAIVYNNMEYASVVENGLDGTARIPRRMLARAIQAAQARNSR